MLEAARQTIWQMMPLGPVGLGNSPYAASSAFAGFPLLIALDQLVGAGWLDESDLRRAGLPASPGPVRRRRRVQDGAAAEGVRTLRAGGSDEDAACAGGVPRSGSRRWLDDFALFMALKDAHGGSGWMDWERAAGPPRARRARTPRARNWPRTSASISGCSGCSSSSGPRCERTPTSAASPSWVTSRSSSRSTAPTCGSIASCSRWTTEQPTAGGRGAA